MARSSDLFEARDIVDWLERFSDEVAQHADWLTALDSAIGDADHGTILAAGTTALRRRLNDWSLDDPHEIVRLCGHTFRETAGGAGGALYASFFLGMAEGMGSSPTVDHATLARALGSGLESVVARGHAVPGDKTFVDVLVPAAHAAHAAASNGIALATGLRACHEAAIRGRDATTPLVARKGRASYLGERSAGHLDPGAASAELLFRALAACRSAYAHLSTPAAT